MKSLDFSTEIFKYIIPYFRTINDVKTILKAVGMRFNNLQAAADYLLNTLSIRQARGVWLDYAGDEVGAQRDEMDFGDYFCVNRPHINAQKKFYFLASKSDPESPLSLPDAEFIQKILAYIGANSSCGSRNEVINIVKTMTNAEKVVVTKTGTCMLNITLYGSGIVLTKNTVTYIQQILGDGIYLEEVSIRS